MTKKTKIWLVVGIVLIILGGAIVGGWYFFVYSNRDSNPWNAPTIGDIPLPIGYKRIPMEDASFGAWLRELPLKERGTKVYLYKQKQTANYQWLSSAVVNIPLLSNDEQCADVCMHLWAEYLFSQGKYSEICFTTLKGETLRYTGGNNRKAFKSYLKKVFGLCNTTSLCASIKTRALKDLQPGDVFVYPHHMVAGKDRYGHAVMVADVVINKRTGKKAFLLVEGNTPARDIHIVRNLNPFRNPWFILDENTTTLQLNVFCFKADDLRHF